MIFSDVCDTIMHGDGDDVFSKKKLLDRLFISFIISIVCIISFFNLIYEEQTSENFAGTLLYVIIFVAASVISYILCDRAVGLFAFGYFSLICLCFAFGFAMELFELEYSFMALVCSIAVAPFYGFMYISEHWVAVSLCVAVIICILSGVISFFPRKNLSAERF